MKPINWNPKTHQDLTNMEIRHHNIWDKSTTKSKKLSLHRPSKTKRVYPQIEEQDIKFPKLRDTNMKMGRKKNWNQGNTVHDSMIKNDELSTWDNVHSYSQRLRGYGGDPFLTSLDYYLLNVFPFLKSLARKEKGKTKTHPPSCQFLPKHPPSCQFLCLCLPLYSSFPSLEIA